MAHIVDATPSSSAGAAQLFAAAAALEDGNEDAADYSSINRWGFNAVQAFEHCILLKTCFHCDGSVTFWFGSKFSISFWFGSKNCVPVHYWNWRVTQNIKFKIKLFLLKHLFQEVPVPVWYLLTSANCKIAVYGTFFVELLKSFWSDAGSGPEDKS